MKHSSHESNPKLAEQSIQCQAPAQPQGVVNERAAWILAGLAIVVVILIGNWELLTGKGAPLWDAIAYYSPLFTLVGDHARAGRLLLWDPWMSGGSPDCADPQSGASSIIIALFGLIFKNPMHAFVTYWFCFWIFGGLGMLLLCRYLKCPVWGGLIATLGFVAGGFFTGHAEHTSLNYSYSFLPWIIWRFDLGIEQRSYRKLLQAALLWGLSALGGYPGMVILTFFFLIFWAIGRPWWSSQEGDAVSQPHKAQRRKGLLFAIVGLLLVAVVGTIIMSPSYLAFFKYSGGYASRAGGVTKEIAQFCPLPPLALGTFSSPFLSQLTLRGQPHFWYESDVSMCSIYLGVILAVLALVSLLRRSPWRIWLAVVAAFFFACSVGKHLPVRGWVYDVVLPTRYFRFPALFSGYAMFAIGVLAALATRDISESSRKDSGFRRNLFLIAASLAVLAAFFYGWILRSAPVNVAELRGVSIVAAVLWFALVWVALLWWRGWITYRGFIATLLLIALADAGSALVIAQPIMYTAGLLPRWHTMMSHHVRNLELTGAGFRRSAFPPADLGLEWDDKNVVVKQAAMAGDSGLYNTQALPYAVDPVLSKIAVGEQRTWFSDQPVWSDPSDAAFEHYIAVSHQLGMPPLVLHKPEQMAPKVSPAGAPPSTPDWGNTAQAMSPATVHLIRYFPNRLEFDYTADKDGWLLVSDRWSPGWKATVNGAPVENTAANFVFRAVPVHRGENRIAFRFEPRGFIPLIILSWSILAGAALWQLFAGARRLVLRRSKSQVST